MNLVLKHLWKSFAEAETLAAKGRFVYQQTKTPENEDASKLQSVEPPPESPGAKPEGEKSEADKAAEKAKEEKSEKALGHLKEIHEEKKELKDESKSALAGLAGSIKPPEPKTAETDKATESTEKKDQKSLGGHEFVESLKGLSYKEKSKRILEAVKAKKFPEYLQPENFKTIEITETGPDGKVHTAKLKVMPDYFSIGTEKDHVRLPLDRHTAFAVADELDCVAPTPKLVEEIEKKADLEKEQRKLNEYPALAKALGIEYDPQKPLDPKLAKEMQKRYPNIDMKAYATLTQRLGIPYKAGEKQDGDLMMSLQFLEEHNKIIEEDLAKQKVLQGQLVAKVKKDVVIGSSLVQNPSQVDIYGGRYADGKRIQPQSTIHESTYADYSHGFRAIHRTIEIDGQPMDLLDALKDPVYSKLLSHEGPVDVKKFFKPYGTPTPLKDASPDSKVTQNLGAPQSPYQAPEAKPSQPTAGPTPGTPEQPTQPALSQQPAPPVQTPGSAESSPKVFAPSLFKLPQVEAKPTSPTPVNPRESTASSTPARIPTAAPIQPPSSAGVFQPTLFKLPPVIVKPSSQRARTVDLPKEPINYREQPPRTIKGSTLFAGDSITVDMAEKNGRRNLNVDGDIRTVARVGQTSSELLTSLNSLGQNELSKYKNFVCLIGTNDIGSNLTASQIFENIKAIWALVKPPTKLYACTIPPCKGWQNFNRNFEAVNEKRKQVNQMILQSGQPNIIRLDQLMADPTDPDKLAPEYDGGDHLHPKKQETARLIQQTIGIDASNNSGNFPNDGYDYSDPRWNNPEFKARQLELEQLAKKIGHPPAGYKTIRGGVPPEIGRMASEVRNTEEFDTVRYVTANNGVQYALKVIPHRHRKEDKGKVHPDLLNWHKGCTAFIKQ